MHCYLRRRHSLRATTIRRPANLFRLRRSRRRRRRRHHNHNYNRHLNHPPRRHTLLLPATRCRRRRRLQPNRRRHQRPPVNNSNNKSSQAVEHHLQTQVAQPTTTTTHANCRHKYKRAASNCPTRHQWERRQRRHRQQPVANSLSRHRHRSNPPLRSSTRTKKSSPSTRPATKRPSHSHSLRRSLAHSNSNINCNSKLVVVDACSMSNLLIRPLKAAHVGCLKPVAHCRWLTTTWRRRRTPSSIRCITRPYWRPTRRSRPSCNVSASSSSSTRRSRISSRA